MPHPFLHIPCYQRSYKIHPFLITIVSYPFNAKILSLATSSSAFCNHASFASSFFPSFSFSSASSSAASCTSSFDVLLLLLLFLFFPLLSPRLPFWLQIVTEGKLVFPVASDSESYTSDTETGLEKKYSRRLWVTKARRPVAPTTNKNQKNLLKWRRRRSKKPVNLKNLLRYI